MSGRSGAGTPNAVEIYLYDPAEERRRFLPFSLSRPLGELRYGALLLRERWERVSGRVRGHLTAAHLADFAEPGAPPIVRAPGDEHLPRFLLASTFVPAAGAELPDSATALRLLAPDGRQVGAVLPAGTRWEGWEATAAWPAHPIAGTRLAGAWQLVGDLASVLGADLEARLEAGPGPSQYGARAEGRAGEVVSIPSGVAVLGDPSRVRLADALVEPHVVLDVRGGPIVLERGVEVRAFTRLAGPLYVGEGSRLLGGAIGASAIGPRCFVHGELTSSLFLGYANKSHDGFVGHSVVGRWVNLGAGTVTSNLKNTYGPVRLTLDGERVETGLTNLGSLIGDHAKTAIGTMLPTGCVVGPGASVFGSSRPSSVVAPFAWGVDDESRQMECARFLDIASRVMPRRDVEVDGRTRRYLAALWGAATRGTPCG